MPGTPATSPRLGIPRYANTDAADFATDVNAVVDAVDASIALVTTLPGSPRDGQEIFFAADATNGVVWRFRYRAASPSAHKWEFVGGPALVTTDTATRTGTSGTASTWQGVNTGNALTPPFPGDYDVTLLGSIVVTSAASTPTVYTGMAPVSALSALVSGTYAPVSAPVNEWAPLISQFRGLGLTAVAYTPTVAFNLATVAWSIGDLAMTIVPVRVG